MTQRHLVTGGAGFLGQRTIEVLVKRGYEVVSFDRHLDPALRDTVEQKVGDVRDRDAVRSVLRGVDVIHHHAALVPLTRAYKDFWSVNVDGARIVAEEAKHAGAAALIHTSSSAVFGKTEDTAIGPSTPLKPIEPYGRSKLAGEQAVKSALSGSEVQVVVVRPRTILGDARGGIFDLFFSWINAGLSIYTIGNGDNRFQFVHIDDLLAAYLAILDTGASGDFNVGTENFGTLNSAFMNLIDHAASSSRIAHVPANLAISSLAALGWLGLSPLAPWHYRTFHRPFYFDMTPLQELGWSSQFSNDQLFTAAYDAFSRATSHIDDASLSPHRKPLRAGILTTANKILSRLPA